MTKIQIDHQADYWNSLAKDKKFAHPFDFEKYDLIISKTASILDYGCGYGRILNELHNKSYQNLTGLDFSKELILRGRQLFPFLNLEVIEHAKIPYVDNYFDGVILFAVLTCIPDDNHQKSLINEIKRVLKPNGIIYISDYLLQTSKIQIDRYNNYEKKYACYGIFELSDGAVLRHHTKNHIEKLLSPFSKLWEQEIELVTMNGNLSTGFQYIGTFCSKYDPNFL